MDHLPSILTHDPRVYSKELTSEDLAKEDESWRMETQPNPNGPRNHNIRLLQTLSPRDVKILLQCIQHMPLDNSILKLPKNFGPSKNLAG